MIQRFIRLFFYAVLLAFVAVFLSTSLVQAGAHEAIVVADADELDVIAPGELSFVYNRVVPGRVVLHPIEVSPRSLNLRYRQGLEESELLGLDESFYIQADLRFEYELNPDQLLALFQHLDEPDWQRLSDYLRIRTNYIIARRVRSDFYQTDADIPGLSDQLDEYFNEAVLTDLNTILAEDGVAFRAVQPIRIYVPDRNRYQAMVNAGQQILAQRLDRIRRIDSARAERDAERITDEAYLARLERVGDLLRRYPDLRDYVAVDRLSDDVEVMVLPGNQTFGSVNDVERLREPLVPRAQVPAGRNVFEANGNPNGNGGFVDLTPP